MRLLLALVAAAVVVAPLTAQNVDLSGTISNIDASGTGTVITLRGDETGYWFGSKYAADKLKVGDRIKIACGPKHCWQIQRGETLIYPGSTTGVYDLPPLPWVVELLAGRPPASRAVPPMDQIRRHCRELVPDSFSLQEACQKQEIESYQRLR